MRKHWLVGFGLLIGFVAAVLSRESAYAGGAAGITGSCASYNASSGKERAALATGYLEGVQAALNKDRSDILVPPEHQPRRLAEPTKRLKRSAGKRGRLAASRYAAERCRGRRNANTWGC